MVEHGVEESVCRGSHVKRVMTRSDETKSVSRMECGQPGNFLLTWCQRVFPLCELVEGVQDCTCDGYSERLLSSVKAHSTSTSGKRVSGCLSDCLVHVKG